MKIVVLNFGRTSVGSIYRIKQIEKIIRQHIKTKKKVIVVSSAMSGVTNKLINKTKQISDNFSPSEYDVLVSSGEQMSCALIAGRLNHLGIKSRSWLSWQVPIFTREILRNQELQIFKKRILKYLETGGVPIITGFQGVNHDNRITTLERGGSDASAIMIAKYFKAEKCIIYTDVEGVYTTDPKYSKMQKNTKNLL